VSQRALQRLRALGYAGVDDVEEGGVEPGEGPTFPVEAAAAAAPAPPVRVVTLPPLTTTRTS